MSNILAGTNIGSYSNISVCVTIQDIEKSTVLIKDIKDFS